MTTQHGNVDYRAIVEGRNFHWAVLRQNAGRKPNGLDFSGALRAKTKPESVVVTSASSCPSLSPSFVYLGTLVGPSVVDLVKFFFIPGTISLSVKFLV